MDFALAASARAASSIVEARWKVSSRSCEVLAMKVRSAQISYLLGSYTQVSVDTLENITSVLRQCLAININKY